MDKTFFSPNDKVFIDNIIFHFKFKDINKD